VGHGEAKNPAGTVPREIRNTANSAPWKKKLMKSLKYLNG